MKKVGVLVLIFLLVSLPFSSALRIHPYSKETVDIKEITSSNIEEKPVAAKTTNYYYGTGLIAKETNGELSYYHKDNLGSTRAITDKDGNKVENIDYMPYGEVLTSNKETFTFTGKELDSSGLQYFGARYYDSSLGRFITVDPIKDGINYYAYAANNPLKFVDPSGTSVTEVAGTLISSSKSIYTSAEFAVTEGQSLAGVIRIISPNPVDFFTLSGMVNRLSYFTNTVYESVKQGSLSTLFIDPALDVGTYLSDVARMELPFPEMSTLAHEFGHSAWPDLVRTHGRIISERVACLEARFAFQQMNAPLTESMKAAWADDETWLRYFFTTQKGYWPKTYNMRIPTEYINEVPGARLHNAGIPIRSLTGAASGISSSLGIGVRLYAAQAVPSLSAAAPYVGAAVFAGLGMYGAYKAFELFGDQYTAEGAVSPIKMMPSKANRPNSCLRTE